MAEQENCLRSVSTPVHNQIAQKTELFFDTTSVAEQLPFYRAAIRQPAKRVYTCQCLARTSVVAFSVCVCVCMAKTIFCRFRFDIFI